MAKLPKSSFYEWKDKLKKGNPKVKQDIQYVKDAVEENKECYGIVE